MSNPDRDPLTPFEGMDIRTLIDDRTSARGAHDFLVWEPAEGDASRWSYADFARALRRFAAGLEARGVKAGDRVLIHLENCPEFLIAWLGCAYAGAVPVTTNARSTLDELSYFAAHSRAVAAITQPAFAALVERATPDVRFRVATPTDAGIAAESPQSGLEPFAAIDGDPATLAVRTHDPMAPFGIQYTSGTTARPKAVLWTHANALWGARESAVHEGLVESDIHLTYLPLFHTNAQVYSVLATLWVGGTVVLMPRFSASRFWPVSIRNKATWTSMVPFCAKALLEQPKPVAHFYRRWGNAVCAAPWDAHFGVTTLGWWGMTETVTHGIVGDLRSANAPMSMGRPAAGYDIHILDDGGNPVAPGEEGELAIRGARGVSLFLEYADNPAATAAAFDDNGLFLTGDRVRRGTDGFLYFGDRAKDMLKVGGENVAASEIEAAIMAVDGVAEVAVVGKPHPMLDEVPVAFVIARDGAQADLPARIERHCAAMLASFKQPREVRLVDSLPRSTLEKVAKAELRNMLSREQQ